LAIWIEVDVTCRLQEVRPRAPWALAARIARVIALTARTALGLFGASFHEPFHADGEKRAVAVTECSDRNVSQRRRNWLTCSTGQSNRLCRIGHCIAESSRSFGSRRRRSAPPQPAASAPGVGPWEADPARRGAARRASLHKVCARICVREPASSHPPLAAPSVVLTCIEASAPPMISSARILATGGRLRGWSGRTAS